MRASTSAHGGTAGTYQFQPYDGSVPDLDFNLRSLRGNAVRLREWRPGSSWYLAWQQSRRRRGPGINAFDLSRDPQGRFHARPDRIILMKADYGLNP